MQISRLLVIAAIALFPAVSRADEATRSIDHEIANQDANLILERTVAHRQIERFANAIRYAEAYQAGARAFLAKAAPPTNADDGKFQTIMRRVDAVSVTAINSTFVKALKKGLSGEEAQELADFFESPAGKKLAEASLKVQEMYTGNLSATINQLQLSNRERLIVDSFTQTAAYQKYQRFVTSRAFGNLFLWELLAAPEFADLKTEAKSGDGSKCFPGIFQIHILDPERAEIVLNAKSSQCEQQKELFSVDRGVSVDIQHAVATKMLDILARQHLERIRWRSNATGEVVLLSMKEQDRNSTKKFLLEEFFHNYGPASSSNPQ